MAYMEIPSYFAAALAQTPLKRCDGLLPLCRHKVDIVSRQLPHIIQVYVYLLKGAIYEKHSTNNSKYPLIIVHVKWLKWWLLIFFFLIAKFSFVFGIWCGGWVSGCFSARRFYSIFFTLVNDQEWHFIYIGYNAYSNYIHKTIFSILYFATAAGGDADTDAVIAANRTQQQSHLKRCNKADGLVIFSLRNAPDIQID